MFCDTITRLSCFAYQKNTAGVALKKAAPALCSGQQKIGACFTLKVAAPAPQHW